jgi:hypothetical protein
MAFEISVDRENASEATPALPHEEIVGNERTASTDEVVTSGTRVSRPLKESTRKLLEGLPVPVALTDGHATANPPPPEPAKPATAAAMEPAKPVIVEPEVHPDTVRANRLAEHNTRLLGEIKTLKEVPVAGDRGKLLDEIESIVVSNPVAAFRKLMAMAMGVPEDSKEIDSHEQFLESELTSKRIGVPLNEDSEATRKAARTLVAIQREMRARKAEETKSAATPEANSEQEATSFISHRIGALKHAEKYPLLHNWSEHVDGIKPEASILRLMRHGVDIGDLDRNEPIDQLIDKVSQRLETYYQTKADKLPTKSTALAVAPPEVKQADTSGKGVGTISNAIASVAPATLPATRTPELETYRTAKERRIAIIKKHSGN